MGSGMKSILDFPLISRIWSWFWNVLYSIVCYYYQIQSVIENKDPTFTNSKVNFIQFAVRTQTPFSCPFDYDIMVVLRSVGGMEHFLLSVESAALAAASTS